MRGSVRGSAATRRARHVHVSPARFALPLSSRHPLTHLDVSLGRRDGKRERSRVRANAATRTRNGRLTRKTRTRTRFCFCREANWRLRIGVSRERRSDGRHGPRCDPRLVEARGTAGAQLIPSPRTHISTTCPMLCARRLRCTAAVAVGAARRPVDHAGNVRLRA